MKSVNSNLVDLSAAITTTVSRVKSEVASLRDRIAATRAALSAAENGLVPLPELTARIHRWVDRMAEIWLSHESGWILYTPNGLASPCVVGDVNTKISWMDPLPLGLLCAGAPEEMKRMFCSAAAKLEYEPGPRAETRGAVVAKCRQELEDLEQAEERLVDQANAAGIPIEHRSEVISRRQGEQRTIELNALREAHLAETKRQEEADKLPHRRSSSSPNLANLLPSRE
jgi:hypothetical protein